MNTTEMISDRLRENYIVCSLTVVCFLIAVTISLIILILVYITKPRLYTVRHLLICNTAVASIIYCIVQTNNYIFLLFIAQDTSDMNCRWRGYFSYFALCGVAYSFFIQAISRLFISIFSLRYRWLTTFKVHYMLICIQWFLAFIIPLPAIITDDIIFRPNTFCYVPMRRIVHFVYIYIVYYIVPGILICVIYIFIYYRLKQSWNYDQRFVRSVNNRKRDLTVLRNVVILLAIYLISGIPSLLFLLTGKRILYLIGIVSIAFGVDVEKICTVLLDGELQLAVRRILLKKASVTPFNNAQLMRRAHANVNKTPQIIVSARL